MFPQCGHHAGVVLSSRVTSLTTDSTRVCSVPLPWVPHACLTCCCGLASCICSGGTWAGLFFVLFRMFFPWKIPSFNTLSLQLYCQKTSLVIPGICWSPLLLSSLEGEKQQGKCAHVCLHPGSLPTLPSGLASGTQKHPLSSSSFVSTALGCWYSLSPFRLHTHTFE